MEISTNIKRAYFVTGTDTNVGKTWATLALMSHFKARNLTVLGMKPVASGCEKNRQRMEK